MFKFYTDPGHGWLAVKIKALKDLGIADKITSCSYTKGKTAYLEEDCDAATFVTAYIAKYGKRPEVAVKHTDKSSPIRSYFRYSSQGAANV